MQSRSCFDEQETLLYVEDINIQINMFPLEFIKQFVKSLYRIVDAVGVHWVTKYFCLKQIHLFFLKKTNKGFSTSTTVWRYL